MERSCGEEGVEIDEPFENDEEFIKFDKGLEDEEEKKKLVCYIEYLCTIKIVLKLPR